MNILLYKVSLLQKGLLDILSELAEVSLYLSLSVEDTLRIINEVHPDTVIVGGSSSMHCRLIQNLQKLYPDVAVYLCQDKADTVSQIQLTNCRNNQPVALQSIFPENYAPAEHNGNHKYHAIS